MQKWEYLRIDFRFQYGGQYIESKFSLHSNGTLVTESKNNDAVKTYDYLNKLGREGWELVSSTSWGDQHSKNDSYNFKRPIE